MAGSGGSGRDGDVARFRSLSVLICDMVDSTGVRVRLGADGERLLRLLESLTRDTVAADGGTLVKGLGDGAMAVFDAAADAVAAAVRLQRAVAALHARRQATDLQIRIGLSAGDVSVAADDCFGLPVAEAVRLCAAAGAGEILAADVVRALARHGLEVPLTAAGDIELRGLDEPVTAWRVEWPAKSATWADIPLPGRLAAPSAAAFVGRRQVLDSLLTGSTGRDGGHLVLIGGDPGVGKSALAAEFARRYHQQSGAVVVHGGCDEEVRPPYQPFVQSLRHLVRHAPTSALESYVRRRGGDLAVLVPELVDRLGHVPPPRTTAEPADRFILFAAVRALLEEVASDVPLVVVLDDLHWADRGTLLLLKHIMTSADIAGLVVVATFRHRNTGDNGLDDLLAELHRFGGVHRVDLAGLADDEMRELAGHVLGSDGKGLAAVARTVQRETDGNPFFAVQLLRHLRESGPVAGADGLRDLPPSVREVVRRRVRYLGDDVLRLLSIGAVLGAEFSLSAVADLAGMHPDTALGLIEAAVEAAVIREVPGQSSFRFVHAIVQHTLHDDLSETRRRRLHRAAAEARERHGPSSASAAHWLAAGDLADPLRVVGACTAAADEALLARAPDEAAKWYSAALSAVAATGDVEMACELQLRLGEAQRLAGDPSHRTTLAAAAQLARDSDDPVRLARAALASTRWFSTSVGHANPAQIERIEAALAAVGPEPSAMRARLLATLVAELTYSDRADERFELGDRALTMAREVGDPEALFDVLFWRNTAGHSADTDLDRDTSEVHELSVLAAAANDPLRQAMADLVYVLQCLVMGRPRKAAEPLERATRLAEELRVPLVRWLVTVLRGTCAALSGDIADAEKLAFEALELSRQTDQPDASTWFGVQLYMVRYEQGRLTELVDMSHAAIARAPKLYTWHAALCMALTELERYDEARVVVDQLLAVDYPGRRSEPHWLIGMSCLGSAVAALGDPVAAERVYCALARFSGRWASIMPLSLGAMDRVLGELAVAMHRWDAAAVHLERSIAIHDAAGAPGYAARSRIALLHALAATRADPQRSAELVDEVRATLARHDLPRIRTLLDRAIASLRPTELPPAYPDVEVPAQLSGRLHVDET